MASSLLRSSCVAVSLIRFSFRYIASFTTMDDRETAREASSPMTFSSAWFLCSLRAGRTSRRRPTRPEDELFAVMGGWAVQRCPASHWRASFFAVMGGSGSMVRQSSSTILGHHGCLHQLPHHRRQYTAVALQRRGVAAVTIWPSSGWCYGAGAVPTPSHRLPSSMCFPPPQHLRPLLDGVRMRAVNLLGRA